MRRYSYIRPLGLLILSVLAAGCGRDKSEVLARVGPEKITVNDFKQELNRQPFAKAEYLSTLPGRKELLEMLVRRKVILAESHKAHIEKKASVAEQLAELDKEFERQHQAARERLVVGEFFRSLQKDQLKVSDDDVRAFYDKETEARASHILLDSQEKAQEALKRLQNGDKFETVAKEMSQDAASAKNGGDLGYFMKGTLVPEFESAVFSLKTGETSGIVKSSYGYHIVRKTGERKISERPFDEVKDEVRSVLEKRKFQEWLDGARERYKISLNTSALERFSTPSPSAPTPKGGASGQP